MNRSFGLILSVIFLFAGFGLVNAQDLSEEDIFNSDAFERKVAESRIGEETNKLQYLVGGVFLSSGAVGTTADFDGYTASGFFAAKAFVRLTAPRYGSIYLGGNLKHTVVQGSSGSTAYTPPDADPFTPALALSEYHLSFDLAKVVFFRIGNQLIAWGPSTIWTPVDFINLQRINPLESVDLRVGKPAMRVHLPLKGSNFFLFVDFSASSAAEDLFQTTNYGLRWDLTALGFEFGLTGYMGYNIQNRYGFDLSGRLMGFDLYGELAFAFPYSTYDFSYACSLGFQRVFGELKNWTVSGEFFYNSDGEPDNSRYSTAALFSSSGLVPLYIGRMYAYAAVSKQDLIGTVLDGTLYGIMNISDLSFTVRLKGSFDFPRFIPFSVSLAYSGGGVGREFTVLSGDNALSAALEVRFEF